MPDLGIATTTADARKGLAGAELRRGDLVGEYEIETLLGAGGMGQVYAVIHPVIGKRAAVKVLHHELSRDTEAVARFVQEARAVNKIGHPNIVDIFGFGALPDGRSYFVMEQLVGESLRERVRRGKLGVGNASVILDTLALALDAAHTAGIVHRDLKPDNVFLVRVPGLPPQVKLLDFGIAKLLAREVGATTTSPQTQAGSMLGTPAYISPEQAHGRTVDHLTDVYSLGAMAYELYTGELPFPSKTALDMVAKHLGEPPPSARAKVPAVPPAIDALLRRMMSKPPAARPSLAEVRDVLREFATPTDEALVRSASTPAGGALPVVPATVIGLGTGTDDEPPRSRRGLLLAALGVGAVLGMGAAVYSATRASGPAAPKPTPVAADPTPTPLPPLPPPPTLPTLPTPTPAAAAPTQVAADPIPTPVAADPIPTPVAANPTPTPVAANPTPTPPTPVAANPPPTPTPVPQHTHHHSTPTTPVTPKHPTPTPTPTPPPVDLDSPR